MRLYYDLITKNYHYKKHQIPLPTYTLIRTQKSNTRLLPIGLRIKGNHRIINGDVNNVVTNLMIFVLKLLAKFVVVFR